MGEYYYYVNHIQNGEKTSCSETQDILINEIQNHYYDTHEFP